MSRGRPDGLVMRYSWAIGISGTLTPARRPISEANMPPALTTSSVSMSPLSVITLRTRPLLTPMPVTRVSSRISAPGRREPPINAKVGWLGPMDPQAGGTGGGGRGRRGWRRRQPRRRLTRRARAASTFCHRPHPNPPPLARGRGCRLLSGGGLRRLDRRRLGCVALGDHVVDDAHQQDDSKGELVDGDGAD